MIKKVIVRELNKQNAIIKLKISLFFDLERFKFIGPIKISPWWAVFTGLRLYIYIYSIVKLATVVEGDQKAPFSKATTPRCREGHYSFPWIAPLYPWYVPYFAEC